MIQDRLSQEAFTTPAERIPRTIEPILRYVRTEQKLRVLDLGCAGGDQLFALAEALPGAHLTGLDISEPSIRRARETSRSRAFADRVAFHVGDYTSFRGGPFDLILADGVLHLIPVPTTQLFEKLRADLAPGGLLVYTMPTRCFYNRALAAVRRTLRALRHPLTDRLILLAARAVHGRRYGADALRERLPYMYVLPERYDGPELHALISTSYDLDLLERARLPHASVAQMKHRLAVFRKRGA